jgi:hypothetical protein
LQPSLLNLSHSFGGQAYSRGNLPQGLGFTTMATKTQQDNPLITVGFFSENTVHKASKGASIQKFFMLAGELKFTFVCPLDYCEKLRNSVCTAVGQFLEPGKWQLI